MRKEIRFAGFGGQGIALAGYILGRAVALYDGHDAVMTQSYGPEARGGASSANVVISDRTIAFPFVQHPDVLVALSPEAYKRYKPAVGANVLILIDEDLVVAEPCAVLYTIPATRMAEEIGRRIVANIVMLGFFTAVTGMVCPQAIQRAIEDTVKPRTLTLNLEAFQQGFDYTEMEKIGS